MKSLKIFLISFILLFAFGFVVFAEDMAPTEITVTAEEMVVLDEDIQAQDLGISEPKLLPDSPFYFLKNWARGIQSFFALDPVRKAELRMKFANEKLIETKKIIEEKKDPEIIKETTENYQKEIEKIKEMVERIRKKAKENLRVEKFLDNFIHQQTLHQKVLQRLENQVPAEAFEKIKEAREEHLERFKDVMLKLEDRKEKITEKLDEILEKQKGSEFKNFKNLEILKELEEKVPEEAKDAIQKAQENALKRLREDLEKMSPEEQEKFKEYIKRISGDEKKHLEILENLKQEVQVLPLPPTKVLELKEKLEKGKEKMLEKIEKELEKLDCPLWTAPAAGFCKEGRTIVEKDPETGCPLPPKCVLPGEIEIPEKPQVCITLWDPVCGKDGKTYSNECFAKLAGVEIEHKGECQTKECQTDTDCPQLRCGPAETRCIGIKSKCVEGKCQIIPVERPVLESCKNLCGDGICQEIVCMATDCPCPETKETCPTDCK